MGKIETIDMFGGLVRLDQLKAKTMEKARDKGVTCPCCDQFVKVYKRTITSTTARQLIYMHHLYGAGKWFHIKNVIMDGSGVGDFTKLEHWGLIKRQYHSVGEEGKKTSGLWRITETGRQFLFSEIDVPKYAVIYNAKCLELKGEGIDIETALGQRFDYSELMQPIVGDKVSANNSH